MKAHGLTRLFSLVFAVVAFATTAVAQQNWRWANSLPASTEWKDVAYGAGLYVVVGADATIATSPDGAVWTIRRMNTAQIGLNAIAYANGRFVAVGLGTPTSVGAGLIMTSTDGINWTINSTVAAGFSAQFADVVYGNGTWVVSGLGFDRVLTSTDGLTWAAATVGATTVHGTYGAGKFIFTTGNNSIATSLDGITWTRSPIAGNLNGSNPFILDVTYGAGKFLAVGRDNNFVGVAYTSADGATWTAAATIAGASGSNGFLAAGSDGTKFITAGGAGVFSSPDGITWTKRTSALSSSARQLGPNPEGVSAATVANGQFFVLGGYGSITTSPDGTTWTRRSTGTENDLGALLHDGTKFIASGSGGTILTSPDGTTWTSVTTGSTADFNKLASNGTRFVAAGFNGIYQSTNLTAWTTVSGTTFDRYSGLAYGNSRFVAALASGTRTSTDGVTWSSVNILLGSGSLVFGNGVFVITATGGGTTTKLYSSTDGVTWTDRTPSGFTADSGFDSLVFGGGRFVALTFDRRSLTSTDGISWTVNTLPASPAPSLSTAFYVGTQFVARSSAYGASSYVSADGVTWTLLDNSFAPNAVLTGMLANGNTVVGIGSSGIILRGDIAGYTPPMPTTLSATVAAGATVQWQRNGSNVAGATSGSLTLDEVQPSNAGLYAALVTASGVTTSQPFVVGVPSTVKVVGLGSEILSNQFVAFNNNTFDQVALQGAAATVTADNGQITRMSFIDLSDDIVQVEFSGAGSLSVVLDAVTGPATPTKYNQPATTYLRGNAAIVIVGANETTNVSVFSVGSITAVNQSLFKSGVTYDGLADIAFIAISTTNGKFGGIRTSNASYLATKGYTGIYAPGVQFTGPVFVGDINASDNATPVLIIGSSTNETRITGGDLFQANGQAISVSGLTQLKFTDGTTSHGVTLSAQTNKAVLKQGTTDVTSQIVVNPTSTSGTATGGGKELTFFAGTNPPYANGAKKTITASSTTLQFDSTTLTNPVPLTTLTAPYTGATFTDPATTIKWEVIFKSGELYEINLSSGSTFRGQWSF